MGDNAASGEKKKESEHSYIAQQMDETIKTQRKIIILIKIKTQEIWLKAIAVEDQDLLFICDVRMSECVSLLSILGTFVFFGFTSHTGLRACMSKYTKQSNAIDKTCKFEGK